MTYKEVTFEIYVDGVYNSVTRDRDTAETIIKILKRCYGADAVELKEIIE